MTSVVFGGRGESFESKKLYSHEIMQSGMLENPMR